MIVADTSAVVTLASTEVIGTVLEEFDVHTTQIVISELEETAEHEDVHGEAAERVLELADEITIRDADESRFESSRIDKGEASCVTLTRHTEADFLITDDLQALPEIQELVDSKVAISPIVLKALAKREVLEVEQAEEKLDLIADRRDWLGAPIYRRAKQLF